VVIDCGTGSHGLGQALIAEGVTRGCLLISHTHWDHIQGLPFFAPLFNPTNTWDICGPKGLSGSLRETLAGQMESTYFPVALESLGATIRYWDLLQGSFQVDDIRVTTHHLNHPALTLAYRLEVDGATIVYACDHELYTQGAADGKARLDGPDLRHAQFATGADLLIHDAQYVAAEYPAKINWGHSTIEYAMAVAREAGVAQLALTHHDPLRTDDQLDVLLEGARATMRESDSCINVFAAMEGQTLEVTHAPESIPATPIAETARHSVDEAERSSQTVLLALHDADVAALFGNAISADPSIRSVNISNVDQVKTAVANTRLSLAILDHDAKHDAFAMCRAIAEARAGDRRRMPIIVVADGEFPGGEQAGIAEWVVRPFSSTYVEAKIAAWVHRGTSRWKKAAMPANEAKRLTKLGEMALLDTPPDPRFDRVTRLASRLFAVPIVLVSLVDRDRDWFKSSVGLELVQTSRESSFSAHTVFEGRTLVVNDALVDDRFAENPLVVGEPRVRFYAGAPLIMQDGSCIGSLCLLDTRPRWFAASDVQVLEDLRDIAVSELEPDQQAAKPVLRKQKSSLR